MAVRPFRYGSDTGITDLTIGFYDSNDMVVTSALMPETSVSGIYRADVNLTSAMEWGLVKSASKNIQFIFRLPYNEISDETATTIFNRAEFVSLASNSEFSAQIEGGKWEIFNNQMIFFKPDGLTEIARFNLFDAAGTPSETQIYRRERV